MKVPLRKKEKEITDPAQVEALLRAGKVLRLAMCRDGQPYLVPLNYGYGDGAIWVHTGRKGLKVDFLAANPKVCFEITPRWEMIEAEEPCEWNCAHQSVIGFGNAVMLEDEAEREKGLKIIVEQHAGGPVGDLPHKNMVRALVVRIDIESMTGKRHLL